jgi:hypothetical protein
MTRRRPAEWMMAAEAFLLLSAFRVALAFLPVRRIVAAITRRQGRSVRADNTEIRRTARRVEWAVRAAARHSPVEFVCFPQALAGYTMLRRRNVASTVVYGVARSDSGDLLAHTWLTVGDEILLGREAAPEFAPIERWS